MSDQRSQTITDKTIFDMARSDFNITKKKIYLNNGSISPLPVSTIKSMTDFCLRYSETGPDSPDFNTYLDELKNEVRQRLADLIKSQKDEIIFTQSTTEGINLVANGIRWKSADRILIRNQINEHHSNYLPWLKAAGDFKLKLEVFPLHNIESTGSMLIKEFEDIYLRQNHKLISTSHVMYNNGSITPVEYFGRVIKESNNDTLFSVDGAQSVGAIDVNVKSINCEFMTFPSFKWICGPLGIGVLFVKKKAMNELNPIFVGSGSAEVLPSTGTQSGKRSQPAGHGSIKYNKYPEKYHASFRNFPGLAGLEASLRYLLRIGINNIQARNKALSSILRDELSKIKELVIHEAEEENYRSTLVSFSFKKKSNEKVIKLNSRLRKQGIILAEREIGTRKILRASPHFYNSEDELQKTSEVIRSELASIL
ncbi:aminotransferase class V-fold PLP-dependent enzyme [Candidatus Nitrosocosmicus franklandus]|uniref:Cysteine desulfurase n=1 Tax=Candidatus Nitrosocosmicus franklandianus TaxID=1798806 RepID=A0A484I9C7_9ARCH|nr:aminotransferase class V-fold PLP-dependent enzyme [Candidatus Nitrosocosmicus franklandus]VFJ12592.1 Cysteine desulfurase [Candidatus Nitrosocosmicus franklandus]